MLPRSTETDAFWGAFRPSLCLLILSGLFVLAAETGRTTEAMPPYAPRNLYAVNQSAKDRGSFSVYDIDAGHRLIKTIQTVPNVGDVRGVAVSAVTGKLYVAYRDVSGTGMAYCLNFYNDTVLWNRAVPPGVDSGCQAEGLPSLVVPAAIPGWTG